MDIEDRLHEVSANLYDQTLALARIGDLMEYRLLRDMDPRSQALLRDRQRLLAGKIWPGPTS